MIQSTHAHNPTATEIALATLAALPEIASVRISHDGAMYTVTAAYDSAALGYDRSATGVDPVLGTAVGRAARDVMSFLAIHRAAD